MYDNKVMEVVENIPADANLIATKWAFTEKDNKKKKVKLVALGYQQVASEDFIETYFPTVQEDSLRLTVTIIIITGIKDEINYTVNKLKDKYKISKDSNATKVIGINIYKTSDGYKINQRDYINKIIEKYNMKKTKQIKNSMQENYRM